MKLWLICPGTVVSANDGDRHYVGARELMRLYDVPPEDCIVENGVGRAPGVSSFIESKLIKLRPRYDGNYTMKAVERMNHRTAMREAYEKEERDRVAAKWKGIPVKDPAGNIVGRVIEAKLTYGPDSAIITAEVEPSFARYLTSSMRGEFSVGD
jgi:hypothetical protein